MNLSTLQKYAAITGQTIIIEGDSNPVWYIQSEGKTYAHIGRAVDRGHVYVGDASSRHDVHVIRYSLWSDGQLFFEARRNYANGAEQKSWNREFRWCEHVAQVVGLDLQEL